MIQLKVIFSLIGFGLFKFKSSRTRQTPKSDKSRPTVLAPKPLENITKVKLAPGHAEGSFVAQHVAVEYT